MTLAQTSFLYVDDHPASRQVMQLMLTEVMGVTDLTMFSNSENLVERMQGLDTQFDIIFLDLHMGPKDGFSAHQLLRQQGNFQSAKIVALTASIVPDELARIRQAGFDGLILKPLRYETFPDQVERLLAGENVWEGLP